MIAALWAAVGLLAAFVLEMFLREHLDRPGLRRTEAGREIPISLGIVICGAVAAVVLIETALFRLDVIEGLDVNVAQKSFRQTMLLVGWLAFSGLLEHVLARHDDQPSEPWLIRILVTPVAATMALNVVFAASGIDLALGVLIVTSAANLAVVLDEQPGRVIKLTVIVGVAVAIAGGVDAWEAGPLVVLAVGAGVLPAHLARKSALGPPGAAVLGGSVGMLLSQAFNGFTVDSTDRVAADYNRAGAVASFVVIVVLLVVHETIGFGVVFKRVAPLRWIDRLGVARVRQADAPPVADHDAAPRSPRVGDGDGVT